MPVLNQSHNRRAESVRRSQLVEARYQSRRPRRSGSALLNGVNEGNPLDLLLYLPVIWNGSVGRLPYHLMRCFTHQIHRQNWTERVLKIASGYLTTQLSEDAHVGLILLRLKRFGF